MARTKIGYVPGMLSTPPDETAVQSTVFGHLPIVFDARVLRPRPWTVAQSRWAAELLRTIPGRRRVLELCAGAGHIGLLALALADARSAAGHLLVSVDVNPAATEFVRRNAQAAGLGPRVDARVGSIGEVLAPDERYDLVIADPPWVPRGETVRYPDDPVVAIDGGTDGLDVVRDCIRACENHLLPGGSVLLQLGSVSQARRVQDSLLSSGSVLSLQKIRTFGSQGVVVRLQAGSA
jgi:release factor glutamine methyltransferase